MSEWLREKILAWNEPIRFQRPNQDAIAAPVFRPPDLEYSWFQSWSEPIRFSKPNQDSYAAPTFTPAPIVVPPVSWFIEWSLPLQPKKYGQDSYAAPVFRPPDLPLSWYQAWPEQQAPMKRLVYDAIAGPVFVSSAVAPTSQIIWLN